MRLNLRKLVLGTAIALLPQFMIAQEVTVEAVAANNGDATPTYYDNGVNGNIRQKLSQVPQTNQDTWISRPSHLIGGLRQYIPGVASADSLADYDGIIVLPFQIPEIPAGKKLKSVSFSSYVEKGTAWGVMDIDLYVLDTRDNGVVQDEDFFVGAASAAPANDFLVQAPYIHKGHNVPEDVAARTVTTEAASNALLTSYFQDEYTAGNALKYTFLRMNFRTAELATYLRLQISSADHATASQHPKLTFVFEDESSTSDLVLADIEDIITSTISTTSMPIDTHDANQDDKTLVVTVTKADGTVADGIIVETHWSGLPFLITVDGAVATAGDYTCTVTNAGGDSVSKPFKVVVEDGTKVFVAGRNWPNLPFDEEAGVFTKVVTVVPHSAGMDAGINLSEGALAPDAWGDCSVIVRFKPDGTFDARNGGAYQADAVVNYTAGKEYTITLNVDVPNVKYSVSISEDGGAPVVLAKDYFFRNQNAVKLDHVMLAAYLGSYTLKFNSDPVIGDIADVVASTISTTSMPVDVSDADQDAKSLVISVTKADGTAADGVKIETHWSGLPHLITIDGSVAAPGDYIATVTDNAGATASKPFKLIVEDGTKVFVAGRNWPNAPFAEETGVFTKVVKVIPHSAGMDAGVTMSEGSLAPDAWGDCSVIVRFKPDGTFDARDGGAYKSDAAINYTAGKEYTITLDVDVPNVKYSVSIAEDGGAPVVLAKDYYFRNQNAVKLDHVMLAAYLGSYTLEFAEGLSIGNNEISSLDIYPNPSTNGEFTIELPNSTKNFDLQVLDVTGKIVFSSTIENNSNISNVSANLNSGLYIVKLSSDTTIYTQKLMVK